MKHLNIKVAGTVQGVFFRASTKAVADQLGIKGFVINLPDESVFIEAEGDQFALDNFLEWCTEGPEKAVVKEIRYDEAPLKGYRNFEVLKKVP